MKIAKSTNGFDNRDMDIYRFFVADLLAQAAQTGGVVRLAEDQAHHARAVLRLEAGERVTLFDGAGASADGLILGGSGGKLPNRGELSVKLEGGIHVEAPPAVRLTIAAAVPKGERAEWLVEQASQLNVAKLQWLACDRGVVKPREGGGKIDKWRRLAVESAKQCGRLHLMAVEEFAGLEDVLKGAAGRVERILWLEPREGAASVKVAQAMGGWAGNVTALIGPEGGWSEREFALLEAAAQRKQLVRVRLTTTVLRIETACAAIAAIVMSS